MNTFIKMKSKTFQDMLSLGIVLGVCLEKKDVDTRKPLKDMQEALTKFLGSESQANEMLQAVLETLEK